MDEDKRFVDWYIAHYKATYMPGFENGIYPNSQRAQTAWVVWQAALAAPAQKVN